MILNTRLEKPNKPERLKKQYKAIFQDRQLTTRQKQKVFSLYMRVVLNRGPNCEHEDSIIVKSAIGEGWIIKERICCHCRKSIERIICKDYPLFKPRF